MKFFVYFISNIPVPYLLFMRNYTFLIILFVSLLCNSFCKAQSGNIYTTVGIGTAGFAGDGGLATAAKLNSPTDVFKVYNNSECGTIAGDHAIGRYDLLPWWVCGAYG